eukprot:14587938-Alexandrium_andersonii.AAC.1
MPATTGSLARAHNSGLAGPPTPMLRASARVGPRSPSPAARTARSDTNAHKQQTIQSGMPQRSRTRRSQGRPTLSNARD